jgi:hypothetical protein
MHDKNKDTYQKKSTLTRQKTQPNVKIRNKIQRFPLISTKT